MPFFLIAFNEKCGMDTLTFFCIREQNEDVVTLFYSRAEVKMRQNKKEESYFYVRLKWLVFCRGRCDHTQRTPSVTILSRDWELKVDHFKWSGEWFWGHMKSFFLKNRWKNWTDHWHFLKNIQRKEMQYLHDFISLLYKLYIIVYETLFG